MLSVDLTAQTWAGLGSIFGASTGCVAGPAQVSLCSPGLRNQPHISASLYEVLALPLQAGENKVSHNLYCYS